MLSVFRDLCTLPKWTKMILSLLCFLLPSFAILVKLPCLLLALLSCFENTVSVLTEFQNFFVLVQFLCFVSHSCVTRRNTFGDLSTPPTQRGGVVGRTLCVEEEACFLPTHTLSRFKNNFPKYQYNMELLIWNSPAHRNPEWLKLNLDNVYNLVCFTV